jgi:hypothetical protein
MKIRPGRARSIIAGIAALAVMLVGLIMLSSVGSIPAPFVILWILIGLLGAGASFYNAFSSKGLPLYEVDLHRNKKTHGPRAASGIFCPNCGNPTSESDRFCKHCGHRLSE